MSLKHQSVELIQKLYGFNYMKKKKLYVSMIDEDQTLHGSSQEAHQTSSKTHN
jgi:hypothetical protein